MCQRYARKLTTPDKIYILSAKYGLLKMTDVIEPYNTTLGDPGAISVGKVYEQAKELDLLGDDCIAIGGRKYVGYCKAIWSSCATPLQDNVRGGNGKQLQWMKSQL